MSRTPARFTQADVARALRAVEATGAKVTLEVLPDGTIRLVPFVALDKPSEPVDSFQFLINQAAGRHAVRS
jgi:hypothetical protein